MNAERPRISKTPGDSPWLSRISIGVAALQSLDAFWQLFDLLQGELKLVGQVREPSHRWKLPV